MVEIRAFPDSFGAAEVLGLGNRPGLEHSPGLKAALARHAVGEPRRFWRYMVAGERPV